MDETWSKRRRLKSGGLTDLTLKGLIKDPPTRQTDIPDAACAGLSARVTPAGRVTWSLRLRVTGEGGQSPRGQRVKGRQYRLTLGAYPTVSTKQARSRAAEYVRQADDGEHPVRALERKTIARHDTIERLVENFLYDYVVPNLRNSPNAQSSFRRHVLPVWGQLPINAISEREAARRLSEIATGEIDPKTGKRVPLPGAAGEVRKWGRRLFSWAMENGLADTNPFERTKPPVKMKPRQRFLDIHEARAAWKAAGQLESPWREVIQLLMLTGCRLREIAHARWSWVDEAEKRLVIPADAYKTGRPFIVALPAAAVAILKQVPRWNEGNYIFSSDNGVRRLWGIPRKIVDKFHANTERLLGRKLEHFVIHDLRRTVRTHLSRLKVSEVVAELVLGHALRGVAGTYNVYDFEIEKREALDLWSNELRAS